MAKNIAWVDKSPVWTLAYRMEILERHPYTKFVLHQTADLALKDLTVTPYDLIVVEPMLASGENYPVRFTGYDFPEFGNDLINRVKKQSGLNRATPLVAIYPLPNEYLIKSLKQNGADEVIDTAQCLPPQFYEIVKKYLE